LGCAATLTDRRGSEEGPTRTSNCKPPSPSSPCRGRSLRRRSLVVGCVQGVQAEGAREKPGAPPFGWGIDGVEVHARDGALRGCVVKNVGEGAANHAKRFFRAVNGQGGFLANVEGTNIVK